MEEECYEVRLWRPLPPHHIFDAWSQNKEISWRLAVNDVRELGVPDELAEEVAKSYTVDVSHVDECSTLILYYADPYEEKVVARGCTKTLTKILEIMISNDSPHDIIDSLRAIASRLCVEYHDEDTDILLITDDYNIYNKILDYIFDLV